MGRRNGETAAPARAAPLKGAQESNELVLLCGAEVVEIVGYRLRFVAVTLNGVVEGAGASIVQQLRARANAPKRRRAHFLSGFLAAGLHDAVTGANVMQQKVAVWMNDLVAQRIGHDESPRGYGRACRRRSDRGDVAEVAAQVVEQGCAGDAVRGSGQSGVARRDFGGAHETREMI